MRDRVASQLGLKPAGVAAVLRLLEDGATVPFIARYRKEKTGDLDEVQIRSIQALHGQLVELESRRDYILQAIRSQDKLTTELEREIRAAGSRAELEDLYLPYKKKKRTRAEMARARGLEPLATRILEQSGDGDASGFINDEVPDEDAALAGARDIVAERVAEDPRARGLVREAMNQRGVLTSKAVKSKTKGRTKFEQYYEHREPVRRIPSHRYLAIRRGVSEGVLRMRVDVDTEPQLLALARLFPPRRGSPFVRHLGQAIADAYQRLLSPAIESEIHAALKDAADRGAIDVFADNVRELLLAPPLGAHAVIGIDPGLRTGCKCAAVDATGKYLDHRTIFLQRGEQAARKAADTLVAFVRAHRPHAIAVGNGTGGREAAAFVRETLDAQGLDAIVVPVNEAGASVYSASDVAREEFPDLDLTIRGAISIARRLADPLAELVKIEPKAIGVGQYQHDVHQPTLSKKLDEVVESCVNAVGVDLNTASASLLRRVAGIGPKLAHNIVAHRQQEGAFASRRALKDVKGLGPRAFEQCSGFLRINGGDNPLDASAVHPERYRLVRRVAKDLGVSLEALVGDPRLASQVDISRYVDDGVGALTMKDIVAELEKPGRDPRRTFAAPRFRADVNTLEDLTVGMRLEGVVTNVTHFGAFVDVGVHQDGLVHISELADHFVKDPREVVRAGDRVQVRVLEVDRARKRISLSRKSPG